MIHVLHFLKLTLGNTRSHGRRRRTAARRHIDHLIHQLGARPPLVRQEFHLFSPLSSLNLFDIGQHAAVAKRTGQLGNDQAVAVKASQCNKLPDIAQLAQVVVEAANFRIGHATGVPVETGRQVVRQHLMRIGGMDAIGKVLGVGNAGDGRLHPNHVGVRSIGNGTLDAIVNAGCQLVVAFADAAEFPVKVDLNVSIV
jgi:hypothetical protein